MSQTASEQWLRGVVRRCSGYRSNEEDDLCQLARLVVWRAGMRYEDLSPALARTFVDKALRQHGQRAARRPTTVSLDALVAPTDEDAPGWDVVDPAAVDPALSTTAAALRQWFDERIARLPDLDRKVLLLRYGWEDGQERSLREVAVATGVSVACVRWALARAHQALRTAVESEGWTLETLLGEVAA